MNDLKALQKINSLTEAAKQRKLAQAMNNPGGHAKDAEKGRSCKRCEGVGRVIVHPPAHPYPRVAIKCPDCT